MTNGYRNVTYLEEGGGEQREGTREKAHGKASIMSPKASLAANRTQSRGVQASFVAAASGRGHDRTGGVGDRHSHSKIRTALLSSSRSRVSLETNRTKLVLRLPFFFFICFFQCYPRKIQGRRGGRGEGEEEGRIRIALRSNVATARPRSPRGEMRERKHRAEGGRGDMFVSDQQERILAQLAHDDAPVDGL